MRECVYRFYNPATGKSYIGLTSNEEQRHFAHYRRYLEGKRDSKLYASMHKYGWDAFEYEVLAVKPEGASDQWLVNAERIAIKMYDSYLNGYNMTPGGEESPMKSPEVAKKSGMALRGRKMSQETKEKISASNKGRRWSEESRAQASAQRRGRKQSPEHIAARSAALKARNAALREQRNSQSLAG
jgi:group I intron endonuclease